MVYLLTSEDDVAESSNVNDKLWKFGLRFADVKFDHTSTFESQSSFDIVFKYGKFMTIRYNYSLRNEEVLFDSFFFTVLGKEVYSRAIGRPEKWTMVLNEEDVKIVMTSEASGYTKQFILSK